jgi:hypothetical protein
MKAILLFLATGCAAPGNSGGGGDGDIDVDVDADADTDVDCSDPPICDGDPTQIECFCNTQCYDTNTNPQHCGACFRNCHVEDGAASGCLDGECVCGDSQDLCEGTLASTCCPDETGAAACVDLLTDEAHCGTCETACGPPTSSMCRQGGCVCGIPDNPKVNPAECPAGQVCCGTGETATCQPAGSC